MLKLKQVTKPAIEPVTVQQIRAQLLLEEMGEPADTEINNEISRLITAAREWCETYQNRAYITQTFEFALDCWPCGSRIKLPRPPLQSVESLRYAGKDGSWQTWASSNYTIDDFSEPGYLIKLSGSWPGIRLYPNGLITRYVSGYGNAAANVPETIKQAIILLASYWYENGECEPPCAVYNLLNLERVIPV